MVAARGRRTQPRTAALAAPARIGEPARRLHTPRERTALTTPPSSAAPDADAPALALPKRTTPTWEMELLISGVTVFAVLQVPGWLQRAYVPMAPQLAQDVYEALQLLWMYASGASLVLAATFLLHLVMRGYWVALVGLHSVYPDGIRLEGLKLGLRRRRIIRSLPSIEARIDAADNRATRVFALGIAATLGLVFPALMVTLAALPGLVASRMFDQEWGFFVAFLALAAMFLPYALAISLDVQLGERQLAWLRRWIGARATGWLDAAVNRVIGFYEARNMGSGPTLITHLISSHEGERRTGAAIGLLILVAILATLLGAAARYGDFDLHMPPSLPGDGPGAAATLRPAHYLDHQAEPQAWPQPMLPSARLEDGLVPLFIPYTREHDAWLQEHCAPAARPEGRPGRAAWRREAEARLLLACLRLAQPVRIDGGAPLADWAWSEDPRTGQRGLQVMLPLRGMAPGRHLLEVAPTPGADGSRRRPTAVQQLPFWYDPPRGDAR